MAIMLQIALAALIFQGTLATFVDRGIALALIGAIVMGCLSGVLFGYRGTITISQNPTAAVLGLAAAIAAGMANPRPKRSSPPSPRLSAARWLASGAVARLLGRFRLGLRRALHPVSGADRLYGGHRISAGHRRA